MGEADPKNASPDANRQERTLKFALYVVTAMAVVLSLVFVEASIGHDGLLCEIGLSFSDRDDDCGGIWH